MSSVANVEKAEAAQSSPSWNAELDCVFEAGPRRTIVRRSHSGPLTLQRPFYPEGDVAHVYLLHPPGGVVGGDRLQVNVQCKNNGKGLITTPGATKYYRSDGKYARVHQCLENHGGTLEWLPAENIFYSGCKVDIKTNVSLEDGQSLAWWDINCFGITSKSGQSFQGDVSNSLNVEVGSKLVLRERMLVEERFPLSMSCGLRSHNVAGTLLLTPLPSESVDLVRSVLKNKDGFSATHFDEMLLVRYVGDRSEQAKDVFGTIWSKMRLGLNSRAPSVPRIWAT